MTSNKIIDPIDIHVGNRVRMRRMMLNMSQEKLGETCKISFQQIQKYEKGTNRISASRLHHFATVLKVPVAFFFEGLPSTDDPENTVPVPRPEQILTEPMVMDLAVAFNQIDSHHVKSSFLTTVKAAARACVEHPGSHPVVIAAE